GEYPDEVAGMVLVEASHPEQFTRFAELGVVNEIPDAGIRPVIWMLSHLGSSGRFKGPRYSMPEDVYMTQQAYLPVSSMAWYDESVYAPDTLEQAGRIDDLGDIPLIVLASAKPSSALSADRSQELVNAWIALQTELAGLSTNGELRIFEDAGHYLHDENPDAVIQAVLDVVEAVKSR
ncbi:MAG: hypothetical protein GWN30_09970, partial [Gammaproteobacteria bacterium]|nr:hypothetical protein [Gammaproteobacteria bacterium]